MNTQAVATRDTGTIAENVIAKGDLGKLSPEERTAYYVEVCRSVGLNPLTQPLAYITLNNKLTLYALKGATDQLRKIHGIAVTEMTEAEREGVVVVTVKVADATGRTDIAKGAVSIAGLKGEALANGIMKAETKAKRRATLSICGLGMLDESEVETIPGAMPQRTSHRLKQEGGDDIFKSITMQVGACTSVPDLQALHKKYAATIATWPDDWQATFASEIYDPKLAELQDQRKHAPKAKPLSEEDSAKVRASLIAALYLAKNTAAITDWRDANADAFRTMSKADQRTVADERDARTAELWEQEQSADGDGVVHENILSAG